MDNLSNSSVESLNRVKTIAGQEITRYNADLRDVESMEKIFTEHSDIYAVIHFAGLKAVGESAQIPLAYYKNNISGKLIC